MKVLILGCGEMGEVAIEDLYQYGEFREIIIGTRSIKRAERVLSRLRGKNARLSAKQIDVNDVEKLEAFMKGFDVVVNCVGPNYKYEELVARAAIKVRVNLVDLNDEYETTFKMLDLDEEAKKAESTIILGLGASPGINNILVRNAADQLDEVEEIHTAWIMSGSDPGGLALSYHLLYSLSGKALTYQNEKLVEVESFIDGKEQLEFPGPVGKIDVFHIGHPEPITLSRSFSGIKHADNKASFNPPFINDLIRNLGKLVREADGPIQIGKERIDAMDFAASYLHKKCKSLKGIPKEGGLRVEVKGKKGGKINRIIIASSGRIAQGTGIAASIGAQMLAKGKISKKGVLVPEDCINPSEFLEEILSRGIGELDLKMIEE